MDLRHYPSPKRCFKEAAVSPIAFDTSSSRVLDTRQDFFVSLVQEFPNLPCGLIANTLEATEGNETEVRCILQRLSQINLSPQINIQEEKINRKRGFNEESYTTIHDQPKLNADRRLSEKFGNLLPKHLINNVLNELKTLDLSIQAYYDMGLQILEGSNQDHIQDVNDRSEKVLNSLMVSGFIAPGTKTNNALTIIRDQLRQVRIEKENVQNNSHWNLMLRHLSKCVLSQYEQIRQRSNEIEKQNKEIEEHRNHADLIQKKNETLEKKNSELQQLVYELQTRLAFESFHNGTPKGWDGGDPVY